MVLTKLQVVFNIGYNKLNYVYKLNIQNLLNL